MIEATGANNTTTRPARPAGDSVMGRWFKAGATPNDCTNLSPHDLNQLQGNLLEILTRAGVTPSLTSDTLLADAIQNMVGLFAPQAILSETYESTPQPFPASVAINYAHGFVGKPKFVKAVAVCAVAGEGYAVGDEVLVSVYQYLYDSDGSSVAKSESGVNVVINDTHIKIGVSQQVSVADMNLIVTDTSSGTLAPTIIVGNNPTGTSKYTLTGRIICNITQMVCQISR